MKVGNQYIIPFRGLKHGEHNFNFEFDREFFLENHELEVPDGFLKAMVTLDKKSGFIVLKVKLEGFVRLQCDRCLEYFNFELSGNDELFVKFKDTNEEPDDKVIFLHPNEDMLDLNQYFFDLIGLNIPIQKFHPGNSCDSEMLNIIDRHSQKGPELKNNIIDPRWSKLKDLLNDDNKNN